MDIFDSFATDETKEVEGVKHPLGGGSITVARLGNTAYASRLTSLYEQNEKELKLKTPEAEAKGKSLMLQVEAETVLVGVEGLTFKGQPVANTVEGRKELLAVKDFRELVLKKAGNMDDYRAARVEADAGN